MRYTPNGKAVTSFSLATSRRYTTSAGETKEETDWFRISVWGKQAEACNQQVLFLGKPGAVAPLPEEGVPEEGEIKPEDLPFD
jgi:single-strand DNA-binding protein